MAEVIRWRRWNKVKQMNNLAIKNINNEIIWSMISENGAKRYFREDRGAMWGQQTRPPRKPFSYCKVITWKILRGKNSEKNEEMRPIKADQITRKIERNMCGEKVKFTVGRSNRKFSVVVKNLCGKYERTTRTRNRRLPRFNWRQNLLRRKKTNGNANANGNGNRTVCLHGSRGFLVLKQDGRGKKNWFLRRSTFVNIFAVFSFNWKEVIVFK